MWDKQTWVNCQPIDWWYSQSRYCLFKCPDACYNHQSSLGQCSLSLWWWVVGLLFFSPMEELNFLVFVRVYLKVCACLCWKRVKFVYISVHVKIYCWRQSRGCQVAGPIKGRSPLLTPEGTWFLTKEEKGKGAISWLKTENGEWMNKEGCSSYKIFRFLFFSSVLFYSMSFY